MIESTWISGLFGLGAFGLSLATAPFRSRHCPALLSNKSNTCDIAARLGYCPTGNGPFKLLTRLPKNEIFHIEVAEKELCVPGLPKALDGLSIVQLSDVHFSGTIAREYFEEVTRIAAGLRPDIFVFTGDLLDDQSLTSWLPSTFGQLEAPLGCYFVLGNHDWYLEPEMTRQAFREIGWKSVAGKTVTLEHQGNSLAIGGTEKPWMGEHADFTEAPGDAVRLLLSHTPDNIAWAKEHDVNLMLAGHNHGGQIAFPGIGPLLAPSRYGCRYASGQFVEGATVLHVSRGVSGYQPIRYGCLPEITKLVLR